jgi:TetR/AcrR family transcriptional regulator, transcriptional repressor for nem operon
MSDRLARSNTDTKTRILNAAEAIMLEKGFNGVGLNEILKAVNVPKGSFYHWFPSKEQFGVELIRHYAEDAVASKRKWMTNKEMMPNAAERIIAAMEAGVSCLLGNDCQHACLILKLANEVATWSEDMRKALQAYFDDLLVIYTTVIEEGQKAGQITKMLPAAHLASILHDVWYGAYLRALVLRNTSPVREGITLMKAYLAP